MLSRWTDKSGSFPVDRVIGAYLVVTSAVVIPLSLILLVLPLQSCSNPHIGNDIGSGLGKPLELQVGFIPLQALRLQVCHAATAGTFNLVLVAWLLVTSGLLLKGGLLIRSGRRSGFLLACVTSFASVNLTTWSFSSLSAIIFIYSTLRLCGICGRLPT